MPYYMLSELLLEHRLIRWLTNLVWDPSGVAADTLAYRGAMELLTKIEMLRIFSNILLEKTIRWTTDYIR